MVKTRLSLNDAKEKGWLLDGYPRSFPQAKSLEDLNIRPDVYIMLDVCLYSFLLTMLPFLNTVNWFVCPFYLIYAGNAIASLRFLCQVCRKSGFLIAFLICELDEFFIKCVLYNLNDNHNVVPLKILNILMNHSCNLSLYGCILVL